ncbi:hypothetical protein CcaCcLH18_11897 [Colletotrichum camelliae]|nr:hypothetical protein CcaCcLH18_11897 [Colletotrichum camelliae]
MQTATLKFSILFGQDAASQGETTASLRLASLHLNFIFAYFNLPPALEIVDGRLLKTQDNTRKGHRLMQMDVY